MMVVNIIEGGDDNLFILDDPCNLSLLKEEWQKRAVNDRTKMTFCEWLEFHGHGSSIVVNCTFIV